MTLVFTHVVCDGVGKMVIIDCIIIILLVHEHLGRLVIDNRMLCRITQHSMYFYTSFSDSLSLLMIIGMCLNQGKLPFLMPIVCSDLTLKLPLTVDRQLAFSWRLEWWYTRRRVLHCQIRGKELLVTKISLWVLGKFGGIVHSVIMSTAWKTR